MQPADGGTASQILTVQQRDPEAHRIGVKIGGYVRHGNVLAASAARRELDLHKLRQHAKAVVDSWGPVTASERAELAELLRPWAGGGDRAAG